MKTMINQVNAQGQREGYWQHYQTGPLGVSFVVEEGCYVKGLQEGEWNYYYASGNFKGKGSFHQGIQVGEWSWSIIEGSKMRQHYMFDDKG